MDALSNWISGASDFPARWMCGNWTKVHGWIHITSDILVWSAYFTIPVILICFISKRKDMPFPKIFWLFGVFIFACGTGHLLEAIIYWIPIYRVAAFNKMLTALVSWATVAALIPIIPVALSLKSPQQLQAEIDSRIQAENELKAQSEKLERVNQELQKRQAALEKRTNEIHRMNEFMIGRELKMKELKVQIKDLNKRLAG